MKTAMKTRLALLVALLLPVFCLMGEEPMSPQDFLAALRRPLRTHAWGETEGLITCKKEGQEPLKGEIRVRMTFTPDSMHAQVTLNDVNVYGLDQTHAEDGKAQAKLDMPPQEAKPSLFDFGIVPEDLTFSFIYWDFVEELPRETSRLRECRVMKLADPKGNGTVHVWFNAGHGFPMEAWWFEKGADKPWRKLELKGAKRHANGLWFVKEMRLEGKDWKTQVRFDHAEINNIDEHGITPGN